MAAAQVVTIVGALLTVAGLVLVVVQMLQTRRRYGSRSLQAQAGPLKFALKTAFPGLVVLAFGVVLLVVGAVVSR